ncbi:hypothetical protein EJ08DRAFT_244543 [Tothia fuscella]|uniref:NADH dehydrogenase [ubiquinone] 1 alpha subcomplex assembly factor 3 n=1 Tax=Tothia fuscella TaxID=1048955 RepID=A0A9P4TZ23_9PEZI|nr:hypothetical protein EJ08DRAFT_244543 [Tothia fuscella]
MANLSSPARALRNFRPSSFPNSRSSRPSSAKYLSKPSPTIRISQRPAHLVPRPYICHRCLHTTKAVNANRAPKSRDRGPASKEDTQTDFGALNVLGNTPPPASSIESTSTDGFTFDNQLRVSGCGVLLVGGEVFRWKPWTRNIGDEEGGRKMLNGKGQWDVDQGAWGVLDLVWPKPDLLIIGTGPTIIPISPATRRHINDLGIRVEVQDTRNAAAQFNLLATERGVQQVAAALIPLGWKDGR